MSRAARRAPPALFLALALGASLGARAPEGRAGDEAALLLVARIPLVGVGGRIDHLSLDAAGQRLFVAALGNDSVEVVDLAKSARSGRIEGLHEPQGVLWLADPGRLLVTNGEGGDARLYGPDLAEAARVRTPSDPDNVRAGTGTDGAGRAWLGAGGESSGALVLVDARRGEKLSEIALSGHPEAFQLEADGRRAFVNVPSARAVEVLDRDAAKVVARWALPHGSNFPMALDEGSGRLFVACRRPARLVVLDTKTGAVVADVEAPGDADDVFVDAARHRVYVSAGAGVVRVYARGEGEALDVVGDVPTAPGARTSLFDPDGDRLYVAAPRQGKHEAEILVLRPR